MPNGVNTKLATALTDLSEMIAELSSIAGDASTETSLFQENIGGTTGGPATKMALALYDLLVLLRDFEGGSIMALLEQISNCVCQALTGRPPSPTDPGGCTSPVSSLSSHGQDSSVPGKDIVLWAKPVPNGFTSGTLLNGTSTAGEIIAGSLVSALSVYVQSAKAGQFSFNPELGATHPTNQWVAAGDITDLAINVLAGLDAIAFLCYTLATVFNCTTTAVVYSGDATGTFHHVVCSLSGVSGPFNVLVKDGPSGGEIDFTVACIYDGSVHNWQFHADQPWSFFHRDSPHDATSPTSGYSALDVAAGVTQTIASTDGSWFIRLQSGATPEGHFTITPPA